MNPVAMPGGRIEPTISYHFVTSLCEAVDDEVVSEGLDKFGLGNLDPNTPRVPFRPYIALFEWFADKLQNPYLGLQLSQESGPEALGAVGYMFLGSRNLEMAIRTPGCDAVRSHCIGMYGCQEGSRPPKCSSLCPWWDFLVFAGSSGRSRRKWLPTDWNSIHPVFCFSKSVWSYLIFLPYTISLPNTMGMINGLVQHT